MDAEKFIVVGVVWILASLVAICNLAGCGPGSGFDSGTSSSRTFYVSSSPGCAGRRPCYTRIQDAVDAASQGDVVKVAGGIYTATVSDGASPSAVIHIKEAVRLMGGYRVDDWSPQRSDGQPAIIDAEQIPGRRGIFIDGRSVPTITVKGFRVRGGVDQGSGGGGIYVSGGSVVLEDNVVEACTAESRGGGVFIADGKVRMKDNTLRGNVAQLGAGLYVTGGSVLLDRNTFFSNEASPLGGAIAIDGGVVSGTNDLLVENLMAGAGVYLSGGHLTASHWTLVDNGRYGIIADLGIDIDRGSASLRKSIVASHGVGLCGAGVTAHQTLFHCVDHPCMAGASCVNNLFGDPKFVDPGVGDYHIAADSAAVDRGYGVDVFHDMDGDMRPVGSTSDIGADELAPRRVYLPLVVRHVGRRRH